MSNKKQEIQEDLRKWVQEKWVDIGAPDGKGGYKPCGRSKGEKRKGYPKCVPAAKARSMSKGEKRSAVKRKRAAGNAGPKPTMVKTKMREQRIQSLQEKLCARGKAAAKRKFKVYPSAYANMYASAVCSGKVTPGGKKKKNESSETYQDMGMLIAEMMGLVKNVVKAAAKTKAVQSVAKKVGQKVVDSGNKKIKDAETGEASGQSDSEVRKTAASGHRRLKIGQAIKSIGGNK
jgi:hypothetical protein